MTCVPSGAPDQDLILHRRQKAIKNACPNRTCLWSCVGRQVTRTRGRYPALRETGSRRPTGELRLRGGSRLKATTDRAFSSLSPLQKVDVPKRLVFLAGRAEWINSLPNDGCPVEWHAHVCVCAGLRSANGASPTVTARPAARRRLWIAECRPSTRLHRARWSSKQLSAEAIGPGAALPLRPSKGMPQ